MIAKDFVIAKDFCTYAINILRDHRRDRPGRATSIVGGTVNR